MTDRENQKEEFKNTCDTLASSLLRLRTIAVSLKNENHALRREMERLTAEYADERAAHNSHVTELCNAEAEVKRLQQENKHQILKMQQMYGQSQVLQQERDKAVEGLKEAHRQMDNARLIISKLGVSL